MMACDRKTLLLISCYADGEATAAEAVRAAEHIKSCSDCRKLIEEWNGQRQLLEWACTLELPEEIRLETRQMEVAQRVIRGPVWSRLRWNWRLAGGLASLAVIGLVGYWFATLPPILAVGGKVSSGSIEQAVRVGSRVRLSIGPNSKIVRIDDRTIRLDQGWVAADVRHGTGFRVLTKRLRVLDQGTRFWVGTTSELDSIIVEEGSVEVDNGGTRYQVQAGGVLVAPAQGRAHNVSFAPPRDGEEQAEDAGFPSESEFVPADSDQLDMDNGMLELAKKFPGVGPSNGRVGGYAGYDGTRYRFSLSLLPGLRRALRYHFHEIAESIAGGWVDDEWEIPVACVLVDGINASRPLPAGVYYIRLVAAGGRVAWRLTDPQGHSADFPAFYDKPAGSNGGSMSNSTGSIDYKEKEPRDITLHLTDWPGDLKPALKLKLNGVRWSEVAHADQPLFDQVRALVSAINGFDSDIPDETPDAKYLDRERRNRLIVKWNNDAGRNLARVCNQAKQGRGGSALLGVIAADSPFEEPSFPAGVYFLRLVLPGPNQLPHLEMAASADAAGLRLERGSSKDPSGGSSFGPYMPDPYAWVQLHYGWVRTDPDGFVFRFWIEGRPDRKNSPRVPTWVSGLVKIKKP